MKKMIQIGEKKKKNITAFASYKLETNVTLITSKLFALSKNESECLELC